MQKMYKLMQCFRADPMGNGCDFSGFCHGNQLSMRKRILLRIDRMVFVKEY